MITQLQIIGQFLFDFALNNQGVTSVFVGVVGCMVWFTRSILQDY